MSRRSHGTAFQYERPLLHERPGDGREDLWRQARLHDRRQPHRGETGQLRMGAMKGIERRAHLSREALPGPG